MNKEERTQRDRKTLKKFILKTLTDFEMPMYAGDLLQKCQEHMSFTGEMLDQVLEEIMVYGKIQYTRNGEGHTQICASKWVAKGCTFRGVLVEEFNRATKNVVFHNALLQELDPLKSRALSYAWTYPEDSKTIRHMARTALQQT